LYSPPLAKIVSASSAIALDERGVGHVETIFTTPSKLTVIFVPFSRLPVALAVPIPWPPSPSAFVGVGHVA
jgi:hypothetical protein